MERFASFSTFALFLCVFGQISAEPTLQAVDDCVAGEMEKCRVNGNLRCCVVGGLHCCPDDEYFAQFPSMDADVKSEPRSIVRGIAKLIGIIAGVAIFVVVACCVCCFCCPFCLFAKRSQGGQVIQRANNPANSQPPAQMAPYPAQPGQQPYPAHPTGAGYAQPVQGYQPVPVQQPGYPPVQQPGYPPAQPGNFYPPPPYPGPPINNDPVEATYEKQAAYNPNV